MGEMMGDKSAIGGGMKDGSGTHTHPPAGTSHPPEGVALSSHTPGAVDGGSGGGGDVAPPAVPVIPPPDDCTAVTEIAVPMVCGMGVLECERWILPPDTPVGR